METIAGMKNKLKNRIMKTQDIQVDQLIPTMSADNQERYEYVKTFMRDNFQIDEVEDSQLIIEPITTKGFIDFVFSILMRYETSAELCGNYRKGKEKFLDLESIYQFDDIDLVDAGFVNHSLDKLELAREMNEYVVLTSSQIEFLLIGLVHDYKNFNMNQGK
jgi:hypothetical protein